MNRSHQSHALVRGPKQPDLHAAMGELLTCAVIGLGMSTTALSAPSNMAVAVGEALLVVMGAIALRSLGKR